jgi:Tol biopolymer transport system component
MDADGSNQTRLTINSASDGQPAWSPDGTQIAFTSDRSSGFQIYVMNVDGTNQTQLTSSGANSGPGWSPDGTQIAFVSNRDGNEEVYTMNADGSAQVNLTSNGALDHGRSWAPSGAQFTFASARDGNEQIYVMNADGSGQTRLTNNAALDSESAWSPDGAQITFFSNRDGNEEIYVMNADGSGQTNLTSNPATDRDPDWQPMPSSIQYSFTGFFQPIDNDQPNAAKAGQSIPIKWRLTDGNGVPIADPSSFVSVTSSPTSGSCSGIPDGIETYAGSSGLQYLGDGYWQFNWKTPKSYAGQCRIMTLNLNDGGTDRTATFIFK